MELLSIIIVSYNNLEVLKNCLDSVLEFNDIGDHLQVIVIEQSPTNEIYNYLNDHYPNIEIYRAENKGFGAGNNRGFEHATAPYLLLLNPDTVLTSSICKFAIQKFEADDKLGLFGVQLLDKNGNRGSSFENIIPYGIKAKVRYNICHKLNHFDEKHMYIQGADMFVRSDVFRQFGGFNEKVFMYCEESDLCTGVKKSGYKIAYFPEKRIIHLQGASSPGKYEVNFRRQLEAFEVFCKKYGYDFKKIIRQEKKYQNNKVLLLTICRKGSKASCINARTKLTVINGLI